MGIFRFRRETPPVGLDAHGQPGDARLAWSHVSERQVDELIGLCKGVLADGEVNAAEADFLLNWLQTNRHAANLWPAKVIYPRIRSMLDDGILDADEEKELLELLMEVSGEPKRSRVESSASTTLPVDDPMPAIEFAGRCFCFTGKFASGTRKQVEGFVTDRGGAAHAGPKRGTHFLVVGETGSRDWIHSTYGRKIERAMDLREKGHGIAIVTEEHWAGFL